MQFDAVFLLDVVVFLAFVVTVVTVGIVMSRHEEDSEGYFLAGRGLAWWLIGFSLIAANISTEQFVGMSGQAANYLGLAIASYEWMAAITLIVVAFFFLPSFLRAGIYTMPEFLEYRFNHAARTLMSIFMMITYVCVTLAAVIYSGAKTIDVLTQGEVEAPAVAADSGEGNGAAPVVEDYSVLGVPINVATASWLIGILAAAYVVAGGLKACAWADLLQGSALIVGGAIILILAMNALGAAPPAELGLAADMADAGSIERFSALNQGKLHMVLPAADKFVPWTALVLGLWIPNFYYWGLNQYITQRTLGSRSLAEGQKGVVFAAALKLLIPFIIVFPGIIAFNLYRSDMQADAASGVNRATLSKFEAQKGGAGQAKVVFTFNSDFAQIYPQIAEQIVAYNARVAGAGAVDAGSPFDTNRTLLDSIAEKNKGLPAPERFVVEQELIGYEYDSAFGLLIKRLVPPGLRGFILAAILGAVVSSLAAMLNAASTIFTMDLYKQYLNKGASQRNLVLVGRICVLLFAAIGCFISPFLGDPRFGGIFTYIQEFQGFISPGILAVFLYGLFVRRAPRACGLVGLLLSPAIYGLLKWALPGMAFLDRMAITFFSIIVVLGVMSVAAPLREPVRMPEQTKIELKSSKPAMAFGVAVVLATLVLYGVFF